MISLIDVECPHCGTHGQITVPPVGSIIIGPCPKCAELVVVFCGQVLALDKETMKSDEISDRREHLLGVLSSFLQDRIGSLLTEDFVIEGSSIEEVKEMENFSLDSNSVTLSSLSSASGQEETITQSEVDHFTEVDLKLLDNRAYFNSVFGDL
ncbi:MAG: hypothetical protein VCC01_06805 [Candidatus Hydrogenedentota bacterium]